MYVDYRYKKRILSTLVSYKLSAVLFCTRNTSFQSDVLQRIRSNFLRSRLNNFQGQDCQQLLTTAQQNNNQLSYTRKQYVQSMLIALDQLGRTQGMEGKALLM